MAPAPPAPPPPAPVSVSTPSPSVSPKQNRSSVSTTSSSAPAATAPLKRNASTSNNTPLCSPGGTPHATPTPSASNCSSSTVRNAVHAATAATAAATTEQQQQHLHVPVMPSLPHTPSSLSAQTPTRSVAAATVPIALINPNATPQRSPAPPPLAHSIPLASVMAPPSSSSLSSPRLAPPHHPTLQRGLSMSSSSNSTGPSTAAGSASRHRRVGSTGGCLDTQQRRKLLQQQQQQAISRTSRRSSPTSPNDPSKPSHRPSIQLVASPLPPSSLAHTPHALASTSTALFPSSTATQQEPPIVKDLSAQAAATMLRAQDLKPLPSPRPPSQCPLVCCFYAVFDNIVGPQVCHQTPKNFMHQPVHLSYDQMNDMLQKTFEEKHQLQSEASAHSSSHTPPKTKTNKDISLSSPNSPTDTSHNSSTVTMKTSTAAAATAPKHNPSASSPSSNTTCSNTSSSSSASAISIFDATSDYIITGNELANRLMSLTTHNFHILARPTILTHAQRYERNALFFSIGMVLRRTIDVAPYRPVLMKLAHLLESMERESQFLSKNGGGAGKNQPKLQSMLEEILMGLNGRRSMEVNVLLDEANPLNLKLFQRPSSAAPLLLSASLSSASMHASSMVGLGPPVPDHAVPVLLRPVRVLHHFHWDLTVNWIVPHIDGLKHTTAIAHAAEVDLEMVRASLGVLRHFGVVAFVDVFRYGNVYECTSLARELFLGKTRTVSGGGGGSGSAGQQGGSSSVAGGSCSSSSGRGLLTAAYHFAASKTGGASSSTAATDRAQGQSQSQPPTSSSSSSVRGPGFSRQDTLISSGNSVYRQAYSSQLSSASIGLDLSSHGAADRGGSGNGSGGAKEYAFHPFTSDTAPPATTTATHGNAAADTVEGRRGVEILSSSIDEGKLWREEETARHVMHASSPPVNTSCEPIVHSQPRPCTPNLATAGILRTPPSPRSSPSSPLMRVKWSTATSASSFGPSSFPPHRRLSMEVPHAAAVAASAATSPSRDGKEAAASATTAAAAVGSPQAVHDPTVTAHHPKHQRALAKAAIARLYCSCHRGATFGEILVSKLKGGTGGEDGVGSGAASGGSGGFVRSPSLGVLPQRSSTGLNLGLASSGGGASGSVGKWQSYAKSSQQQQSKEAFTTNAVNWTEALKLFDHRRFITFGIVHGLIRRVHAFPIAHESTSRDTGGPTPAPRVPGANANATLSGSSTLMEGEETDEDEDDENGNERDEAEDQQDDSLAKADEFGTKEQEAEFDRHLDAFSRMAQNLALSQGQVEPEGDYHTPPSLPPPPPLSNGAGAMGSAWKVPPPSLEDGQVKKSISFGRVAASGDTVLSSSSNGRDRFLLGTAANNNGTTTAATSSTAASSTSSSKQKSHGKKSSHGNRRKDRVALQIASLMDGTRCDDELSCLFRRQLPELIEIVRSSNKMDVVTLYSTMGAT